MGYRRVKIGLTSSWLPGVGANDFALTMGAGNLFNIEASLTESALNAAFTAVSYQDAALRHVFTDGKKNLCCPEFGLGSGVECIKINQLKW